MEDRTIMTAVLREIFRYLIGREPTGDDINIFRKHNNKLETSGDLSFPLTRSAWKKFQSENLDELLDETTRENGIVKLISSSENWKTSIRKCEVENERKLNLFFERTTVFRYTLEYILLKGSCYGCSGPIADKNLEFRSEYSESDVSKIDLTQLRINILQSVAQNLVKLNKSDSEECADTEIVFLTNRSESNFDNKIVCGVVLGNKFGKKNTLVTAEEFYRKRSVDMRLMAEHKYGVRVNSETGWREFFEKLGSAAVTFDLLHGKPSKSLVVSVDSPTSSSSKGAAFILYNCARLAELFKQFEKKVSGHTYPALPDIDKIDFTLLNQPEEWEILYVYLMHYPEIVKACLKDVFEYKLSTHNLCMFLDSLCLVFSVYYRRVRILTEPRDHLISVLHSRIYLLKAVQQILHNTLALLNIAPVKQM